MTSLIPAVRHALDVLGIAPPGHRDTVDEVKAKLAAWTQLRDAAAAAEKALHAECRFASTVKDHATYLGYAGGLGFAMTTLGIEPEEQR